MAPLKIVIVGAGVGGLAAAIGLARNGHQVTIYERLTSTTDVGYAFRITANSDRCLKYLGIDTCAGGAVAANSTRILNAEGETITRFTENSDGEKAKRGTSVFAYRPQLVQQLMDMALHTGVTVNNGVKVESVDITNTTVTLAGEKIISADLIIAADGLHSPIRSHVLESQEYSPKPTLGLSAIRFMLPTSVVRNDDIISPIIDDKAYMFSWKGNEKRILAYPVDYDKLLNITCTYPSKLSKQQISDDKSAAAVAYNLKISFDEVMSIYSDFEPKAQRLFSLADPNGFRVWELQDMEDHDHWSRNKTALLGDACHAVLPFGFSGASMAIEDGATISALISPDIEVKDIPGRLKLYEDIRRPRVSRVRETSRVIATGKESPEVLQDYMMFLASYDAVEHAKQVLSESLGSPIKGEKD